MCGIAGYTGSERPGLLARMLAQLAHRGPDGEGVHSEPGIHLGARRLAIVDRPGGHQPRSDESGTRWVVQNGEIYNHARLARELTAQGHVFATRSDTEAIVHCFEERGGGTFAALDGMFAVALWDRAAGALTLARDRLGEKPLYWTRVNGDLAFASEIKALLEVPGVTRALDHAALDEYLTLQYVTGTRTLFREISKLAPGTSLVFRKGEAQVRRWWTPPPVSGASLDAATLRELLSDAVAARLPDEVPWGCFLSGGIDSGAVAALMARHARGRLKTYTVGFDVPGAPDERRLAAGVARHLGADHAELVLAAPGPAALLSMTWSLDQPLANAATLALHELARRARRDVTVVLTGEGADEVFGGYGKYVYPRLAAGLGATARRALGPLLRGLPASPLSKLGRVLALPDGDAQFASVNEVFAHDARQKLVPGGSARPSAELIAALCGPRTPGDSMLDRMMRFDMAGYLPEDNLMKVDRATMAHGLEARAPYLDTALVERALAAPAEARSGWATTKALLREAARPLLPRASFARRKAAFDLPVGAWLAGPWAPLVRGLLGHSYVEAQGVFAPGTVAAVTRAGTPRQTWTLLAFQFWYLRFLEEPARADALLAPVLDPSRAGVAP